MEREDFPGGCGSVERETLRGLHSRYIRPNDHSITKTKENSKQKETWQPAILTSKLQSLHSTYLSGYIWMNIQAYMTIYMDPQMISVTYDVSSIKTQANMDSYSMSTNELPLHFSPSLSVLPLHTHTRKHHVEQILVHSVSCVLQSSSSLVAIRSLYIMARAVYIWRPNNGPGLFACFFFTNLCSSADWMTKIIIAWVFIHFTHCVFSPCHTDYTTIHRAGYWLKFFSALQWMNSVNFHFFSYQFRFSLACSAWRIRCMLLACNVCARVNKYFCSVRCVLCCSGWFMISLKPDETAAIAYIIKPYFDI